jgi:hypothetical protein
MARKEKKYHFIYKTTNLLTSRYYIGMHSTDNLEDGYMGSGKRLRYSINKYGKQNHKVEILEFFDNRDELKKREKEIVDLNEVAKEECMNLIVGGEGGRGFTSEEQRLNAFKSHKKQKFLKENESGWFEKKSKKISKGNFKQYEEGIRKKYYFYNWNGKVHSDETKKKIGEKNSEHQKGKDNSQYGTCWITKDKVNKKIKKEEFELFNRQGWNKGRK